MTDRSDFALPADVALRADLAWRAKPARLAIHVGRPLAALALAACAGRAAPMAAPSAAERIAESEQKTLAGDLAEGEAVLWPALRESRGAERAGLLLQLGRVRLRMFWFWDSRPDLAAEPIQEGLALAERAADPDLLADGYDTAGMLDYALLFFRGEGDWAAIEAKFARALGHARDDRQRSRIHFHIGLTHQMQGRRAEAQREFEESLALARRSGEQEMVGQSLRHLAVEAAAAGDRARAIALHRESLAVRERIPNRPGVATSDVALAQLYLEAGDGAAAERHLDRALAISRRLGLGYPQVEAAALLAQVRARAGRAAAAEPLAQRAIALARARRDSGSLVQALLAGAEVNAGLGRTTDARAALDEAGILASRSGDPDVNRAYQETARRLGAVGSSLPTSR